MPRFIPDTLRVRDSAKASYDRTGYFYITDSLETRFEVEGVLTAGTNTPNDGWLPGTRFIYSGVTSNGVPTIVEPLQGALTANDIIEFKKPSPEVEYWIAAWSSQGLTSTTPGSDYSSIGTIIYNKETENLLVFTGSEWREVQPASSLKILTTGYTGENTSTLNVFGHTGSKNLVLSGDGSDGTANIELNSPFSSKYFYGPSAPDETVVPLNFGDRWYSTELGSELVWIPNLPGNAAFVAGSTFANDSKGTFQADTNNISFIGQDGKSYIVPQTKFDEFVDGSYDLTQSGGLTGVWVMVPIAGGGGDGSLSKINVDETPYPDVTELTFNSGSNVSISSSVDGSSLSLTFDVSISEVSGATGSTGATGATGVVGTIFAGGNSVVDAQFLSFEDGGIITVTSLTSDSGITVTYSATLVGATGIYVSGSEIGLSANVEDLSNVASIIISGKDGISLPPSGSEGDYFFQTPQNKLYIYEIILGAWSDITSSSFVGVYYQGETTGNLYYFSAFNSGSSELVNNIVTDPQSLVYDSSTSKYVRKPLRLDDISDVTAGSPTDGYYLQYNSSTGKWEPGAPPDLEGITGQVDIFVDGVTHSDQDIIAFTGQDGANGIPLTRVTRTAFGEMGSLLEFGLTGASHNSFVGNKFVNNTSSSGTAKKVLTIADDGSIGWEYLRNYDVVDPNKFVFSVTKFGFDGPIDYLSSHTITAGDPGTTFIASDTYSLTAEYNGDVTDKSFKITTNTSDLNYYYDGDQGTDLLGLITGVTDYDSTWTIKYPSKLTGFNGNTDTLGDVGRTSITVRITATGSYDGGSQTTATRNVVFKFDNYVYAGHTSASIVSNTNTLNIDAGVFESWLNTNPSDSVYRGTYFNNSATINNDTTPSILVAPPGEYCFVMWPTRLGWQQVKKDQYDNCESAIFGNPFIPAEQQTAFQALGITLTNEHGFEERYNIYQFPQAGQVYNGLEISLVGEDPCTTEDP